MVRIRKERAFGMDLDSSCCCGILQTTFIGRCSKLLYGQSSIAWSGRVSGLGGGVADAQVQQRSKEAYCSVHEQKCQT